MQDRLPARQSERPLVSDCTMDGMVRTAIAGTVLPTTAVGAATVGGVAGVGTVALIDSVFQPCRGFHALFGANKDACVNGEYVGYAPRRMR